MYRIVSFITVAALLLTCAPVNNPLTNYDNAKILQDKSLANLPSNLKADTSYQCAIYVQLPGLVDSFKIIVRQNSATRIIMKDTAGTDDSLLSFPFSITDPGQVTLIVYLYKGNGTIDSLFRNYGVFSFAPVITADSGVYHCLMNDSVAVAFHAYDPDGDFKRVIVWIDSEPGVIGSFTKDSDTSASIKRMVRMKSYAPVTITTQIEDSAGKASQPEQCIVMPRDTSVPVITLVKIRGGTSDSLVKALPCTVVVNVKDQIPLDSVKFRERMMSISGDTALLIVSELDSGKFDYIVSAWDDQGNKGVKTFSITYTGRRTYLPRFTSYLAGQSILEGGSFKPVFLDSCITIDSGADYTKDSIKWIISNVDTIGKVTSRIDTLNKKVLFGVADSEWGGTDIINFQAVSPGNLPVSKPVYFSITAKDDPPKFIHNFQCKPIGKAFDTLYVDTIVQDPDTKVSTLSWSYDTSSGKFFKLVPVNRLMQPLDPGSGIIGPKIIMVTPGASLEKQVMNQAVYTWWQRKYAIVPRGNIMPAVVLTDSLRLSVSDTTSKVTGYFFIHLATDNCVSRWH